MSAKCNGINSALLERIGSLYDWKSADEFSILVKEMNSLVPTSEFFRDPKFKTLQEAWIAKRYLEHRRFERIRLISDSWPDFEVVSDGEILRYEITEAYDPTRRRADEYQKITEEPEDDPSEDWEPRVDRSIRAMFDVIQKKEDKGYSEECGLIVYLGNAGSYGFYDHKVRAAAAKIAIEESHFPEMHIYWSGNWVSLYRGY